MSRVVVVGAGVGGLAAAVRLAAGGHDVTIVEQAEQVGGKLGWFSRDGFGFDTGPSLLTMPGVFADLFDATGGPLTDYVCLDRLDPIARYRFGDGVLLDACADDAAFTAELADKLAAGSGAQWQALDAHAERVWRATEGPFLSSPVTPASLARLAARRPTDLAAIMPGRTLRGLGRRRLDDPRLRVFLDRYATYSGSDPRRAPATLVVVPHVERRYGGWYVRGGLRQLGAALAARAAELGVRLRCGERVVAITTAAGRADGVRLASGTRPASGTGPARQRTLPADVVVVNADAEQVYRTMLDDAPARIRARTRARADRLPASLSGFVLLLAVRGRTPGLAHHTVLFPSVTPGTGRQPADDHESAYDAEFDAVFGGRLAADPTIYLSVPPDPAVAPPGCEAWFVLVNACPHRPEPSEEPERATGPRRGARAGLDWDRPGLADAYGRHVLDLLAGRGYDVRDRMLWYHTITPADLERRTGTVGGSIYGSSSNGARAAFLRPRNATAVPGLFLVGGSAHPGGGLPLVAMSARIVADLVGPA